ncbi:MAG TPA: tRNA (adenosine(37)-N6)-threonylcarbamoyltransferase complex ATPase subunit type 1 TsaE [Candidatus Saccharimonadia bacterium]
MTLTITTQTADATKQLAAALGRLLHGGEVIELASDLGGGKTTFTQGLAAGLGFTGHVTSPTFTLSQIYKLPSKLELHHYDLYRLQETGVVGDELNEDLGDPEIITVIEWADIAESDLPADRLTVRFKLASEEARELEFTAGGPKSTELLNKFQEAHR